MARLEAHLRAPGAMAHRPIEIIRIPLLLAPFFIYYLDSLSQPKEKEKGRVSEASIYFRSETGSLHPSRGMKLVEPVEVKMPTTRKLGLGRQ